MLRSDLINLIGRKRGYTSYLGISTPTTGKQHSLVESCLFKKKHLFIYGVTADQNVEEDATFWTSATTSHEVLRVIAALAGAGCYDLVFVDPMHSYENSYEDLLWGFHLVRPGGALVVHDCNPASAEVASADFVGGEWCGLTYCAYLNFVIGRGGIRYLTVDTDYGVGIVFKDEGAPAVSSLIEAEWASNSRQDPSRYRFFAEHRRKLLNLMSVAEFQKYENIPGKYDLVEVTLENFNEAGYLAANPDVRDAIKGGLIPSAFRHFGMIGRSERRHQKSWIAPPPDPVEIGTGMSSV